MSKGQKIKRQITIQVRWNRPPVGWFKLNADGASFGNPGKASGGGLIRDHHGSWVKGYMRHIGFTSNIVAEFWALKDGLMLASQLDITQLLVELDAKVVVDLILSSKSSTNSFSALLNDCRYLLCQFNQVRINHDYREANRCTNHLAKGGCTLIVNFVVLDSPNSDELCIFLDSDASGLYSLRLSASTSPFMAS